MAAVKLGLHEGSGRIYGGPTLVALDRGYFQQQGLDIEIVNAGGRREVFPLFESNELDVSPQGMSLEFVQAFDPERPLIMAADHGSSGGGAGGIVARPEPIESGRLRGSPALSTSRTRPATSWSCAASGRYGFAPFLRPAERAWVRSEVMDMSTVTDQATLNESPTERVAPPPITAGQRVTPLVRPPASTDAGATRSGGGQLPYPPPACASPRA